MANQIAGTQIEVNLTLQDDQAAAHDLTGATLYWRLTRAYSVPGVLLKSSPASGVVIDNAVGGLATVTLDVDDTLDLQGEYYHEVKADYGAGLEKTWQLGTITFSESAVGAD